jgi:uncharacterized OB-fold protein
VREIGDHVPRVVENVIQFPYKRSLGPVFGPFMQALTEQRILGIRCGERVLAPPLEWDPETAEPLDPEFVEVGPAGTVTLWTWVAQPSPQHPLDHAFAFAYILLDGADVPMLHAVDAGDIGAMKRGVRVAPRWKAQRVGRIDDIACFVLGETPDVPADDAGPATQPVEMMDYFASITYQNPVSPSVDRVVAATAEGRILGQQCPECGRIYTGGRGYCPVDAVTLGAEHDVDLPTRGVVTNYTIVTPVQYPGQTETEPFARAMVLLDGTDVVLGYQALIETPMDDVRIGMRVAAVFSPPHDGRDHGGGMGGVFGFLDGWMPTGEPDVVDDDLVNRTF